jgi:xylulose-5-phosphate/fructose-6-phosphate phosphoketolase
MTPAPSLDDRELALIDAYWRARTTCRSARSTCSTTRCCASRCAPSTSSRGCSGHWGTTPGLNFLYAHMNRAIRAATSTRSSSPARPRRARARRQHVPRGHLQRGLPGHRRDEDGLRRLFRQFSFPGGIPSHVAPETPGSIHEGGELGYALAHAYGAALDNPDLLVCCVVGDGEAETGPLATSWHSNKFLDPATDGAVLPVLHLNGYKIANPTVLARIPHDELRSAHEGLRPRAAVRRGRRPAEMHARWRRRSTARSTASPRSSGRRAPASRGARAGR